MRDRALGVLEFARVLEYVAGLASTAAGRELVRGLVPSADEDDVRSRLAAVGQTVRFREARRDWAFPHVPETRASLRRLGKDGSVLTATGLARLGWPRAPKGCPRCRSCARVSWPTLAWRPRSGAPWTRRERFSTARAGSSGGSAPACAAHTAGWSGTWKASWPASTIATGFPRRPCRYATGAT